MSRKHSREPNTPRLVAEDVPWIHTARGSGRTGDRGKTTPAMKQAAIERSKKRAAVPFTPKTELHKKGKR